MDKFRYENQGPETLLVYQLSESEHLDTYAKGMLQSNELEGVLKPVFTQRDRNQYLKYNITSKIPLSEYVEGTINKQKLLQLFGSIANAVGEAEEYMLQEEKFVFMPEQVYVDITIQKAYLVYLPVDEFSIKKNGKQFLLELLIRTTFDTQEDMGYVAEVINYLNQNKVLEAKEAGRFFKSLREINADTQAHLKKEGPVRPVEEPFVQQEKKEAPSSTQLATPLEKNIVPAKTDKKRWFSKKDKKEKKQMSTVPISVPGMEIPGAATPEIIMEVDADTGKLLPPEPEKKRPRSVFFKKKEKVQKIAPLQQEMEIPGVIPDNKSKSEPVQADASVYHQEREGATVYIGKGTSDDENKTVIMGGGRDYQSTVMMGSGQNQGVYPEKKRTAKVTRRSNGQVMVIDKKVFHIGKESSYVDFYIGNNPVIGAVHADIFLDEGEFYISDRNSLNHTYVNGVMVRAGEQKLLNNGDIITLGNEELTFISS